MKPTIYLSNFSAKAAGLHGPGRKLSIMARPRHFEHGDGCVPWLTPNERDLLDAKAGRIDLHEYRRRFDEIVSIHASRGHLAPVELAVARVTKGYGAVVDGDTLCCACSRADAAKGRCHRVWCAPWLHAAGWRVILDGVEWNPESEVSDG